jgi:hypothetical protein
MPSSAGTVGEHLDNYLGCFSDLTVSIPCRSVFTFHLQPQVDRGVAKSRLREMLLNVKSRVDVQMVLSAPAERVFMSGPEAAHKSHR